MILKLWPKIFLALLLATNSGLQAQISQSFPYPVHHFTLNNGLEVILSEDFSLPIVSVVTLYRAGSMDEIPGKTGLAHLLENLMFQGSSNIGRMQHINLINRIGGTFNALTLEDRTIFQQRVPSNQLALVLWMESDRMKFLQIDESKVSRTKQALLEDINRRKSEDPYLRSSWHFDQLAFGDFSYNHPVLGFEEDILTLSVEDVGNFYETFYSPDNAILCIVGNIDRAKTESLVRRYYETLPKGGARPQLEAEDFPEPLENIEMSTDVLAASPGFFVGYRLPKPGSSDFYSLAVADFALLQGKGSRLQRRLVQRERLATYLAGGIDKRRDRSIFKIMILNNSEVIRERTQRALFAEFNKFRTSLLSPKEFQRAKNTFRRDYIQRYSNTTGRAIFLAEYFLDFGTVRGVETELDKYMAVTPSQLMQIAGRYLSRNRIVLNIRTK
jgi:zinc protease